MPRAISLAAALLGTICLATSTFAQSVFEPVVALRIHDYAGTQPDTLSRAQHAVADLLGTVGIRAHWSDPIGWSDTTRLRPPREAVEDITVIALSRRMALRKHLPPGALGSAVVGPELRGRVVYIVADRVEAVAAASGRTISDVMALVIAHEIGHLLRLPHDADSADNVMRAVWTLNELRRFDLQSARFAPAQAAAIRSSFQGATTTTRHVALVAGVKDGE